MHHAGAVFGRDEAGGGRRGQADEIASVDHLSLDVEPGQADGRAHHEEERGQERADLRASERAVQAHGERPGVIEYLHLLKLAAEESVEKVEAVLREQLALPGKWRAVQVREQLAPVARKVIELVGLTPSLQAYDTLLEGEVAHVG